MTDAAAETNIGESYDRNSQLYFDHVVNEMEYVSPVRAALRLFAEMVGPDKKTVDAGCGPGHITAFLASNGLDISGIDISAAAIELARSSFPGINFDTGALSDMPVDDASLDAVVSKHSIIHTEPTHLDEIFGEFARVLVPKGLLFLSFFATNNAGEHGHSFDHAVCTAYQLDASIISEQLATYGFNERIRLIRQPRATDRQMPHAILFARRTDQAT